LFSSLRFWSSRNVLYNNKLKGTTVAANGINEPSKRNKSPIFTLYNIILLKKALLYFLCLLVIMGQAQSQKRNFKQREIGFFAGGSYYIGDINPRGHFRATRPAAGIFFRYETNYRYAFRFGLNYGAISGSDVQSNEPDQKERNLSFKSQVFELSSIAEFNFVEYRIGQDKYKFTMFIFGGISGFYFNPKADIGNGFESLRSYRTEGQTKSYTRVQMSIPFGVGFKLNIGKKCGLGIEWGPRRTFTDYLDDLSGVYPNAIPDKTNFTNRTVNGSATPGAMRGNPSTRDWYFYYGINLSIKLRDTNKPCHRTI